MQKNLSQIDAFLIRKLPYETTWLNCPSEIHGQAIPYFSHGGTVFILSKEKLGFIFAMPLKRAMSYNYKIPDFLRDFKFPAICILSRGSEIILVTKDQNFEIKEDIFFKTITERDLINFVFSPKDNFKEIKVFEAKEKDRVNYKKLHDTFIQPNPKDANFLAATTKTLGGRIARGVSKEELETWVDIAETAIRILPETINNPNQFIKATEALARSIIFLPKQSQHETVNKLIGISLDKSLTSENAEKVASIVFAVAPALERSFLFETMNNLKYLRGTGARIPPSLTLLLSNYSDILKKERIKL